MKTKICDQPSLDFDRSEDQSCSEHHGDLKTNCQKDSEPNGASISSFAEKVAEREKEHKNRLYEGILSRIKHLELK